MDYVTRRSIRKSTSVYASSNLQSIQSLPAPSSSPFPNIESSPSSFAPPSASPSSSNSPPSLFPRIVFRTADNLPSISDESSSSSEPSTSSRISSPLPYVAPLLTLAYAAIYVDQKFDNPDKVLNFSEGKQIELGAEVVKLFGVKLTDASHHMDKAKSTLHDHITGKSKKYGRGRNRLVPDQQEKIIADQLRDVFNPDIPTFRLRRIVDRIARRNGIVVNRETGEIGRKWLTQFLIRHKFIDPPERDAPKEGVEQ